MAVHLPVSLSSAALPVSQRAVARLLAISAMVVLVTVVGWLASLIPAAPSGEVSEQLANLRKGMTLYRLGFVNAALINPAFVVMLGAAAVLLVRGPLRPHEVAGALVLGVSWVLPTMAYVAQFALLPRLLDAGAGTEAWFFGNPASVSYWLAMTGYGLFGVGALSSPRGSWPAVRVRSAGCCSLAAP